MKKNLMLIVGVSILAACASKEPQEKAVKYPKPSPEITTTQPKTNPGMFSRMIASELGTDLVSEIQFREGKADLNASSREKLNKLWEKAIKEGKVQEIQILAWADKEYPTQSSEGLKSEQQDLAKKRGEVIKEFFNEETSEVEFQVVNMAVREKGLSRVTASDEMNVKRSLESSQIEEPMASNAIIMIFTED